VLFLWLAKILYGVLVREMSLPIDRSNPAAGPIVEPELMMQFRMHHYLLQGALDRVTWDGDPASILLYRTKVSDRPRSNFDFADGPYGPFLSMRLGEIGIISVLQDWGALEAHAWSQLEWAKELELAPLQFREIMAIGRYWAYKFNRLPKYIVGQRDGKGHVVCLPMSGLSAKPLWDGFDGDEYGALLASTLGVPVERVHPSENQLVTFLRDDDGNLQDLPFEAWLE
jgi:hypothetical protein